MSDDTRLGKASLALLGVLDAGRAACCGDRVLAAGGSLSDHLRALHGDPGRDRGPVRGRGARATGWSPPRSARCCARSTRTRTSWRPRSTRRCRSASAAPTTASASPCRRWTATSPWSSPFEGTPAHRLGIRAGDVISRIEDEDARGMSIDDAVKRLRGPEGHRRCASRSTRQGYDAPLEFTVIRDEIPLHSVPYYFMVTQDDRLRPARRTSTRPPPAGRATPKDCERELEKALRGAEGAGRHVLDPATSATTRAGCSTRPSRSRTCS